MKRTVAARKDDRTANELRHGEWLAAEETERVWSRGSPHETEFERVPLARELSGSLLIVARTPRAPK